MKGHTTNDCNKWNKDPCIYCRWYNYESKDCWHKDKLEQEKKNNGKTNPCKCARNKKTNATDSDSQHLGITIEKVGNATLGKITFDSFKHGQYFNFSDYNVTNYSGIDKRTLYDV